MSKSFSLTEILAPASINAITLPYKKGKKKKQKAEKGEGETVESEEKKKCCEEYDATGKCSLGFSCDRNHKPRVSDQLPIFSSKTKNKDEGRNMTRIKVVPNR